MGGPNWRAIPGFFSEEDQAEYERLARLCPEGSLLVEVGSYRGRSLASIAEVIRERRLRVWSVDLWGVWEPGYAPGTLDPRGMIAAFMKTMKEFGLDPLAICGDSEKVASEIACFPSLVFIDAEHTEAAVRKDVAAWWPRLMPGGRMAGHDYHPTWAGVIEAVKKEFRGTHRVAGSVWSVEKAGGR